MFNSKLLKSLKEKSLIWGENNPAKALLYKMSSMPTNPLLLELINGKLNEVNEKDLIPDEYGYSLVDYSSVLEQIEFFNKYKEKSTYIPVFGEYLSDTESPLIKNLAFDRKTITNSQNFFICSDYNFLQSKNFNEAIKLIYPNAGKKTFKLMLPFLEDSNGNTDFSVFHFAHYCSIYFQDANHFNEILEKTKNVHFFKNLIPLHYIMERMGEKRLKAFILNASELNLVDLNILCLDTMRMYKEILKICENDYEIDFKSINTIEELHNSVLKDFELISRHGENLMLFLERKFPYLEKLSKENFRGLNIIIPQDKATLIEWGKNMGNCIGGYGESARDGNTIVFALYENNSVKFNIEISPKDGKIRQFVSHSNRVVDAQMQKELQELINKYCEGVVLDENNEIINLPVDRRFLVRVLKTDSPIDEEKVIFDKLFQMNLSPKAQIKSNSVLETTKIGFEENLPKGIISLILEDKNSKGSLCKELSKLEKSAYTGLLKQFKDSNALNLKEKDFREVVKSVQKSIKDGYKNFFIGIDKITKLTGKTPSALQAKDYSEFISSLNELCRNEINIFFVISDVKKAKILNYKDDKILEGLVNHIMFTHKEKIIDNYFKIDVIKNIYGSKNCVLKIKES